MIWAPRDAQAFAHAFMAKLPLGEAWPRHAASTLARTVSGLAQVVGRWADRVGRFLVVEAFPPRAVDTLADWERVLGLPEPCLPLADLTVAERQRLVREKLARRPGAQSRTYFLELASRLGYDITITEYIPAQCGITQCGATLVTGVGGTTFVQGAGCGTPVIRYVWKVSVPGPRLTWFAVGWRGGRAAQDPHLRIRRAEDLECVFEKLKPAHTKLIFDYAWA